MFYSEALFSSLSYQQQKHVKLFSFYSFAAQ